MAVFTRYDGKVGTTPDTPGTLVTHGPVMTGITSGSSGIIY